MEKRTLTFQPDPGHREIMDKAIEEDFYGEKRSYSFIVNKALRLLFEKDGLLPKAPKN